MNRVALKYVSARPRGSLILYAPAGLKTSINGWVLGALHAVRQAELPDLPVHWLNWGLQRHPSCASKALSGLRLWSRDKIKLNYRSDLPYFSSKERNL